MFLTVRLPPRTHSGLLPTAVVSFTWFLCHLCLLHWTWHLRQPFGFPIFTDVWFPFHSSFYFISLPNPGFWTCLIEGFNLQIRFWMFFLFLVHHGLMLVMVAPRELILLQLWGLLSWQNEICPNSPNLALCCHSLLPSSGLPIGYIFRPHGLQPTSSSVHEILQARVLEWVAISFSRGSSRPRDRTWISCTIGRFFTDWTTREALIKMSSKKWQPTPVFLPGEFHGQQRLVGYSPWGHKESDTT